jgi:Cu/Ag efflux pump CusA
MTGASVSLGSMVGFVTLYGIATRNDILLVSNYKHLVESSATAWTGQSSSAAPPNDSRRSS